MASTYTRLPTDEDVAHLQPPEQPRQHRRRILFLLTGLFFFGLASYRFGPWSGPSASLDTNIPAAPTPTTSSPTTTIATPTTSIDNSNKPNNTMPEQGKVSVGYFVNWGIYGRKFPPSKIPAQDLTHILYAFANIRGDTGEVVLSDVWADKDIHYEGDSWNDVGNNLYGNLKAIYKIKKQNRHLKVLLSIGGWTYSPTFHPVVVNPALRAQFVQSAVRILEDCGLDGLDVDYEYPSNDEQARGYVALLQELRDALDKHAHEKGIDYRFLLTIAAPCGPEHYKKLHIPEMNKYLDFFNMMAYDFSGSWDPVANHQANVLGKPINAADAINYYIAQGVLRSKIVMGIPLYGRSFMHTHGPGTSFNGVGGGSWEAGVYDYRALPLPGSDVLYDENALASWTYNNQTKEMVSFDSEKVAKWKGEWIKKEGLAGSMFWELSGDKGQDREGMEPGPGKDGQPGGSLVAVVKEAMGGIRHDQHNWLRYEGSKYDNMRNGME